MNMFHVYGKFPESRPRRLRTSEPLRRLVRETRVAKDSLVMPYFVQHGSRTRSAVTSMPGQFRYSTDMLLKEIDSLVKSGVSSVLLFGIPAKKDAGASEAWSSKGITQTAVRMIKKRFPELLVMTDVCLCGFTEHGHCGVLNARGEVDNDASLEILGHVALSHVEAGADLVAPSDMMDGRVKIIREQLDKEGFQRIPIMSYSAKYASSFYGPFRDAAHSAPAPSGKAPRDRKSYQMDPGNLREAMREIAMDIQEGADIVMVKPALSYLDVIHEAASRFQTPLAAYLVSGEYAMIKAAAQKGWVDEPRMVMEILTSVARAGADILITYHAKEAAVWVDKAIA